MKRFPYWSKLKRLNGFTLVELLVVIAIIAILASALLAAGSSALKTAKRAKAYNTALGIQTAVTSYYTEYSVYPVPSGTTADYTILDSGTGTTWGQLIQSLSGNVRPSTGAVATSATEGAFTNNTRGIAFLSMKAADVEAATDAPVNPIPGAGTAAAYFNIAIDSDYSGVVGDTGSGAYGIMPNFNTSTVGNIVTTPSGTSTAGSAVWANCNGVVPATKVNPNFYVHTY